MSEEKNFHKKPETRPEFPKRAVITGGMPYGNKTLHFGHIGGVFVFADVYARFLRDRIGEENVIFVSGTDCYGSPIAESYRRKCAEEGMTVIISSSETEELLAISDRIYVFYEGCVSAMLSGGNKTPERLVAAMMGMTGAASNETDGKETVQQ